MSASISFEETNAETIRYTLGGDQRSIDIVCKLAFDVQGLKKNPVKHKYISLDRAQKEFHLLDTDVISRIDDKTRMKVFEHDLQSFRDGPASKQIPESELDMVMSCWLPLKVWSKEGKLLSMASIAAIKTRPPNFIRTVGETVANLGSLVDAEKQWNTLNADNDASLSYARVWEKILLDAAVFSGKQNQAAVSRFDVKARFFTVLPNTDSENTNRPLKLFIAVSDAETAWLTPERLASACQDVVKSVDAIPPNQQLPVIHWSQYTQNEKQLTQTTNLSNQQCRFVVATEGQILAYNTPQERLVRLSTNPLNFFSTYMLKGEDDLGKLVDMQVGATHGSWQRPLPSKLAVVDFNEKLVTKLGGKFRKKMSQVSVTTTTESSLTPDATIDTTARQQTQNIMGDSANKWARTIMQWPAIKSKEVVAEWLHREAHRFGGEEADLFPNLIFGSRECNTHMIRAENLINDALRHKNQVAKVDLKTEVTDVKSIKMLERDGTRPDVTIPWWNEFHTLGEYFYWMAPELAYDITVTLQDRTISGRSTFQPFHRYVPFRYELELDKFVLDKYFGQ